MVVMDGVGLCGVVEGAPGCPIGGLHWYMFLRIFRYVHVWCKWVHVEYVLYGYCLLSAFSSVAFKFPAIICMCSRCWWHWASLARLLTSPTPLCQTIRLVSVLQIVVLVDNYSSSEWGDSTRVFWPDTWSMKSAHIALHSAPLNCNDIHDVMILIV